MSALAHILAWLNSLANALGWLLSPISMMPGWLSATIIAAVTGVLLLIVFKYTSNQSAIKLVRADIKANMYALKLFKDSASVAVRAQFSILVAAFWLFFYALVPMAVMTAPVLLILGQIALWYQARPLRIGEEAVITLKLNAAEDAPMPHVQLEPTSAVDVEIGPVNVLSKHEVCWNVHARENGLHHLVFNVEKQKFEKELAIGEGFMRVSMQRPALVSWDTLFHPAEAPFGPDSVVKAIEIVYPTRDSYVYGADWWVIYWFAASMVAAFCFRGVFHVNI